MIEYVAYLASRTTEMYYELSQVQSALIQRYQPALYGTCKHKGVVLASMDFNGVSSGGST